MYFRSTIIFLICLFAISISCNVASAKQNYLSYESAMSYIGRNATICGKISQTKQTNKALFINFGGTYPNHKFTNVIFNSYIGEFIDVTFNIGDELCTTGIIELYKGVPEIVLKNRRQIVNK